MTTAERLDALVASWKVNLITQALNGSLRLAAEQALELTASSAELDSLIEAWSCGDFSAFPNLEILPHNALNGAAGAYAIATNTIYLNGTWLASASNKELIFCLTEELGHMIDAAVKAEDSRGDEGEIFAKLLAQHVILNGELESLRAEQDHGVIQHEAISTAVEYQNNNTNTSSQIFQISGPAVASTLSTEGIDRYAIQLNLKDTSYTTFQGYQGKLSAFPGETAAIKIELAADLAPITTSNFLQYIKSNFYDNTIFHRVIYNFMIQGGGFVDGTFNGTLFQQKQTLAPIPLESTLLTGLSNTRGTIAMARTSIANSATSQFFINSVDNSFLNHLSSSSPGYAVFGAVTDGMEIVDAISNATKLSSMIVEPLQYYPDITEPIVTITSAILLDKPQDLRFSLGASEQARFGTVQIDSATGVFTYTPSSSPLDDSFRYQVSIPARQGLPERIITRDVKLWANDGLGVLGAITSSRGDVFEEGVVLNAGSISGDPDGPGRIHSYQWYRNGNAIAGATSSSFAVGFNSIERSKGQDFYEVEIDYIDDQGFESGPIRSEAVRVSPFRTATESSDWIIAWDATDRYRFNRLESSLLSNMDTIIGYRSGAVIDSPLSTQQNLIRSAGTLKLRSLEEFKQSTKKVSKILSKKKFKANQATAFTVNANGRILGTCVAINDGRAGFQRDTDSIIMLQDYILTSSNSVTVI